MPVGEFTLHSLEIHVTPGSLCDCMSLCTISAVERFKAKEDTSI